MAALTPEEFYKANIGKEKEYVHIYLAYEYSAGETMGVGIFETAAEKDGYQLNPSGEFLDRAEFAAKTTSAEDLELAVPKKDLGDEELENITPVKRGGWVNLKEDANGQFNERLLAGHDGFAIKTGDRSKSYMSNFELTSKFNFAGERYETEKETIVTLNNEAPVKGIILEEKTTFGSEDDNHTAPAGSLLYPNPAGGYLLKATKSPNASLRLSAGWTARQIAAENHKLAVENQTKLKARAPRVTFE
jgi:hypothetical protein